MAKTVFVFSSFCVWLVSATVFAQSSGPTLYGRVNVGVMVEDVESAETTIDVRNVKSRFGIKGYEELENGLEAVYKFEFGVLADSGQIDTKERQRVTYVGLQGNFGRLVIGTEEAIGEIAKEYFYSTQQLGNEINPFSDRVDHMLQYNWDTENVRLLLAVRMDSSDPASDSIDSSYFSAQYLNGGLSAGIFYVNVDDTEAEFEGGIEIEPAQNSVNRYGLGLSYDFELFRIGSILLTEQAGSEEDYKAYAVTLDYTPTSQLLYSISLQTANDDDNPEVDVDYYVLAAAYKLSARTRVYTEYQFSDFSSVDVADINELLVGLRHDF